MLERLVARYTNLPPRYPSYVPLTTRTLTQLRINGRGTKLAALNALGVLAALLLHASAVVALTAYPSLVALVCWLSDAPSPINWMTPTSTYVPRHAAWLVAS